ncbi:hypothetical protein SYNPS1DRAFT_27392 [Syncephalis pseudoplumigaleata]|uniref:Uncharacterized protein n=1 Tax=Syncephalis pseudoplumigaleata TaxID=1712513 RepID=A0A4V1J210_9FUNG|nr:hypothetical protein SYNPS1DRAFT_27392 [Syncephalis pseudoplumigaleata]|eukprot:RKP26929.1 hypothetical protein SYNPS1DRAFT_27392 [Syncephalis pseudoplumigaleata]
MTASSNEVASLVDAQANVDVAVDYMNGVTGLSQGVQLRINDTFLAVLDVGLKDDLPVLHRIVIRETAKDRDWLVSHHDLMVRPCQKCRKLFCFDSPADKFLPPVARYPLVVVDEHGVEAPAEQGRARSAFHRQAYHLTCL